MSIFITQEEMDAFNRKRKTPDGANLYWGMLNRVKKYSESPGMVNFDTNTEWWHNATEYLTEAAWAVKCGPKNEDLSSWLRGVTLDLCRRSEEEWVGPFFRWHNCDPKRGHLETAHLSIAVAVVYDLCPEIFADVELEEIKGVLKTVAIPQCVEWIKQNKTLANWHCILLAGASTAAAVIDDKETLAWALEEYKYALNVVQNDGSYAESLQYSNYCYFGLMFTYESLVRTMPELLGDMSLIPYAKAVDWFVQSYMYNKPLEGWGAYPRPRSVNFNDSHAIFGADPDLLMHISARVKDHMPEKAALARWMFDTLYPEYPAQGPFDRNTFGFINRYSFFSMVFYGQAAEPKSPVKLDLATTARFDCGDYLTRSSWGNSKTVLGFRGASEPLMAPGHLHADINSFMLAHNKERLLVDPGHACYRNFMREYEVSTKAHNTCVFTATEKVQGANLQESLFMRKSLGQELCGKRHILPDHGLGDLVDRKIKHLICDRVDDVTVFGSDAGALYGAPLTKFERFTVLCGEHALFVVDRIEADSPVKTSWNWLLNNRDGLLEFKLFYPDRFIARRGNAGIKMFHVGDANLTGPHYGHVHDAYHPLPNQLGEGKSGSGLAFRWDGPDSASLVRIHAVAVDTYGLIAAWHLRDVTETSCSLDDGANENWSFSAEGDIFAIEEKISGRKYKVDVLNGEILK
ncbi:MAG: heparinase II/III family protein [Kiritimatiellae bacterium]|jgi:hypothetical protein|nr:heparinase II/III family protein [Kiritimatiellia bacterium]